MAVNLSPVGGVAAQFFDNAGNVLTGGKLYTYAAGTTTPQIAYTTSAGNVAWSNPIILDAAGRVSGSGEIWLTDGVQYKFILRDSNDVLIATYDNVIGINSNFVNFTNEQEIQTATAGQTVFNLTTTTYSPGTNSLSVFVDGVNQYGPGAQYAYLETDSDTVTFVNGLHVGALVKFTTSQLNSSGGVDAQQVSYNPPFVDAVATNVEAKLAQTVSALDFGAVGDGITDNTVAMQAAHATGRVVYYPAGDYRFSGNITIASGGIKGDGISETYLVNTDVSSNNLFTFTNTDAAIFRDFQLQATPVTKTSGAGIYVNPGVGNVNSYSLFENVNFLYIPTGIEFVSANHFKIIGCNFISCSTAGCQIENQWNGDSGDSVICASEFNTQFAYGVGIIHISSGGLKIVGNKFNGGVHNYVMDLNPQSYIIGPAGSSVLVMSGNSFEGASSSALTFNRNVASSENFELITISGNEFGVTPINITTDSNNFIKNMVISGNVMGIGSNGTAISLNTITNFNITGNVIDGFNTNDQGIVIIDCVNGKIGSNTYSDLTTDPVQITTSTNVSIQLDEQSGTSTGLTTGFTGLGALYQSALISVTFPVQFKKAPADTDIQFTPYFDRGVVSATLASVTATGFTYYAISTNNTLAPVVFWKAWGIL
jgi:hypothetical protein